MSKIGKNILLFISGLPLLWTIGILICAYFYVRHPDMVTFFMISAVIYLMYGGLVAWLLTLLILVVMKKISVKTSLINLALVAAGLLAAYLSITYDVFRVSGSYID